MTEYWKSNARKYCEFCKCWMADNKISISYHESGKRHKENVAKKLSAMSKKSIKDHKLQKREDNEMRKMEKAALAAYMKDIENNADLMSQSIKKTLEETDSVLTFKGSADGESSSSKASSDEPILWNEVVSADGSKYYWNTQTKETTWDQPDRFTTTEEQEKRKKKEFRKKKIEQDHAKKVEQDEKTQEINAHLVREKMKEFRKLTKPIETSQPIGPMDRPVNPLGSWVPVVPKPQGKIDLQLPKQDAVIATAIPMPKDEPMKNFREKTVLSMDDSYEPIQFKKRKFGGGAAKHSRQRGEDD